MENQERILMQKDLFQSFFPITGSKRTLRNPFITIWMEITVPASLFDHRNMVFIQKPGLKFFKVFGLCSTGFDGSP